MRLDAVTSVPVTASPLEPRRRLFALITGTPDPWDECVNVFCSGHGECGVGGVCVCKEGYTGRSCEPIIGTKRPRQALRARCSRRREKHCSHQPLNLTMPLARPAPLHPCLLVRLTSRPDVAAHPSRLYAFIRPPPFLPSLPYSALAELCCVPGLGGRHCGAWSRGDRPGSVRV